MRFIARPEEDRLPFRLVYAAFWPLFGHNRVDRPFWRPKVVYLGTFAFTRKSDREELLAFLDEGWATSIPFLPPIGRRLRKP